ncbi:MAG: GlsB/YeaQ/YmgE family stress response membrane protein, partial [Candidatus Limnocylindrales bacterium]
IANLIAGGREGLLGTIVLGIVGAVVGGFIAGSVLGIADITGFNLSSILVAIFGAVIVLVVWHAFAGRRGVANRV